MPRTVGPVRLGAGPVAARRRLTLVGWRSALGVMSDVPKELAACSAYLKQAAQIAPQSVATAIAIVMLSCARECAELGRQPEQDPAWESLRRNLHARSRHECRVAPSTAPLVERLLHYFESFGEHHLRNLR